MLIVLAGCGGREAFTSDAAALVGQPETAMIAALGVPLRSTAVDGRRFVEYDLSRWDATGAVTTVTGVGPRFAAIGNSPELRRCSLTFEIAAGTVRGFSFRGEGCTGALPRSTQGGR
jgi:hypothetical protein